jgi:predicted secreted protein
MTSLRPLLHAVPLLLLLFATQAAASDEATLTTIELSAEAARPAANDLARASVFAEASGATPSELANRVNSQISDALKTAKTYANVKAQSGTTHSYPIYAKDNKIEGWRMRSELTLESRDSAALSELLGKLQTSLGVANLIMLPSPEAREQAESKAIIDAIAAFKVRAKTVADALGTSYRIKLLSINSSGRPAGPPMMRAAAMTSADAAAMPTEAGETQIRATISGQIVLTE